MKLLSGILTITLAIIISIVAEYFSIVGLAALFAATAIPVMIMGAVLGAGKLVSAQWLKTNWSNKSVNALHKTYLLFAILALMLITSLGIYGFLSKGHLEQQAPVQGIELQIEQKQQQIVMIQNQNKRLTDNMIQMDSSVNIYLKGDNVDKALKARQKQKIERQSVDNQIDTNNIQIQKINNEVLALKLQSTEVEAKLGPIKYVAELFGWQDPNTAVRFVIMTLMFAFDPLAIVLLLSGTITISEYLSDRKIKPVSLEPIDNLEPIENPNQADINFLNQVMSSGNAPIEVQEEVKSVLKPKRKFNVLRKTQGAQELSEDGIENVDKTTNGSDKEPVRTKRGDSWLDGN